LGVNNLSKLYENSRFWKFSRNRLAGKELSPSDSSVLCDFWVPKEEPPGGMSLAARRGVLYNPVFWVFVWRA